eukprot:TRINITY_DN6185_c0_g2_i1.p1 TRINITY_DN6185_c0_g2~~TRINITY_DN6185_c0_g2_i1.p1  ORF type:complete len:364 (+),score=90.31 TRINITY_DN6185_c0_g2_i1:72-1094(+)
MRRLGALARRRRRPAVSETARGVAAQAWPGPAAAHHAQPAPAPPPAAPFAPHGWPPHNGSAPHGVPPPNGYPQPRAPAAPPPPAAPADLLQQRWRALVINLDRRKDRMERLVRLLSADEGGRWLLRNSQRLPGVDGGTLDLATLTAEVVNPLAVVNLAVHEARDAPTIERTDPLRDPMGTFSPHLTRGALGCALSHRKTWQLVGALGLDWALVLEDDLCWATADFRARLAEVCSQLPAGWDVAYLGYHGGRPTLEGPPPSPTLLSCGGTLMCGIYGYMLSRAGAEKLLSAVFPLEEQVDVAMARAAERVRLSSWKVADGGILLWSLPSQLTMDTDVQRIR